MILSSRIICWLRRDLADCRLIEGRAAGSGAGPTVLVPSLSPYLISGSIWGLPGDAKLGNDPRGSGP